MDVARKLLDKGDLVETGEQLEETRESKQDTSDHIRAFVRGGPPLSAKGLAEALESFTCTDEVGRDSGVHFQPGRARRRGADRAARTPHRSRGPDERAATPRTFCSFSITVRGDEEFLELQLRDNGVGFDSSLPGPEGRFGMTMMREQSEGGGH